MASASKDKGSGNKGAAKAKETSRPAQDADPTHDSPKRHGDKLEKARDAAAGRGKGK